jgi:xanthine/CO dehydrogenase XdhC/CoxF family maturation factor
MGSDELARGARDAERDDVLNELVSREAAERDYGVVLTADGAVDVEVTTGALSRILPRA